MLTRWNPHADLFRFSRGFDSLFSWEEGNGEVLSFKPAVDIKEDEDRVVIVADLPGVDEKDIDVQVHDGVLQLSGKREESKEEKSEHGYYRERRYGSFHRRFRLGSNVDAASIEATYKNGELTVVLPKKEEAKPRQIPVSRQN